MATGRARAEKIKPISQGDVCEWAGLRFAGGGVVPIIGCRGNPAYSVHHGPDKSVLNNRHDNLHSVCKVCHARFHAINDPYYGALRPKLGRAWLPDSSFGLVPHNTEVQATEDEIEMWNQFWKNIRNASRHQQTDMANELRKAAITFALPQLDKMKS